MYFPINKIVIDHFLLDELSLPLARELQSRGGRERMSTDRPPRPDCLSSAQERPCFSRSRLQRNGLGQPRTGPSRRTAGLFSSSRPLRNKDGLSVGFTMAAKLLAFTCSLDNISGGHEFPPTHICCSIYENGAIMRALCEECSALARSSIHLWLQH